MTHPTPPPDLTPEQLSAAMTSAAKVVDEYERQMPHWPRTDILYGLSRAVLALAARQLPAGCVAVCERCFDDTGEAVTEHCGDADCPLRSGSEG